MKKVFFSITAAIFGIIIISLPSCFRQKQPFVFKYPIVSKTDGYSESKNNVNLYVKELTPSESLQYFDVDLIYYGYIPLYINIKNNSNYTHIIHPSYISIRAAEPAFVARKLHYDTSLFVTAASCLTLLFWWPGTIWVGQRGYDMANYNKQADSLIKSMTLENKAITLLPHQDFETFIFVEKSDFQNLFSFKIFNTEQKQLLVFNVDTEQ